MMSPGCPCNVCTITPENGDGHFDDRLRGLDSQHRLVDRDRVADVDVPTDDFRLGETFAEIRKIESRHLRSVRRRRVEAIR